MNAIQAQLIDLNELEELRCNTRQHTTLCSVRADRIAIPECGAKTTFWCAKRYKEHLVDLETGALCLDCKRPVELCWTVVAI